MRTHSGALPLPGLGCQDGESPPAVSKNLTTTNPPSSLACAPPVPHPCLGSNCLGLFPPAILGLPLEANCLLLHSPPGLGWQRLGVQCHLTGGAPGRRHELRLCLSLCRSNIQRKKFKLPIRLLPSHEREWHVTPHIHKPSLGTIPSPHLTMGGGTSRMWEEGDQVHLDPTE